jgi:hypothetical protein
MEQSFHAQLKNGNSNSEMQETKYLANGACVYPAFLLQPVSKAPCHSPEGTPLRDGVRERSKRPTPYLRSVQVRVSYFLC